MNLKGILKIEWTAHLYLCIVSPLYHEPLVANVAEKVAAGLVKRSGRGILKLECEKKLKKNVHRIEKYTIFANDRLLRLLTD